MRVAILGSGNQARLYARALAKTPGVVLAGIGARRPDHAQALADRWRTSVHSPDALIADKSIDAIVIATPTATHAAFACAAFAQGKHVFCECPIAHTLAEADAMIAAAQRADRVLQVGLIHRFETPYEHLVATIKSGALGRVHGVETTRLSAHVADGAQQDHHGGDAIEELLTFDLHFLSWAFGRPASIAARSIDQAGRSRHVAAIVAYPDLVASCTASSFLPTGFAFTERTRLFTEEGLVELTLRLPAGSVEWVYEITRPNAPAAPIAVAAADPSIAQMGHFVETARGVGGANRASGAAAREMLELTLAAATSARGGKTISLA